MRIGLTVSTDVESGSPLRVLAPRAGEPRDFHAAAANSTDGRDAPELTNKEFGA